MQRIRHRAQFDAVLAGPAVVKTQHFALHMADSQVPVAGQDLFPGGGSWLGVLIPKRWARRAVTRNALRRQIYAVAQELSPGLPPQALVVRLRSGFSRSQFPSAKSDALKRVARDELLQLLGDKLRRRWAEQAQPAPGGPAAVGAGHA